MTTTRSPVQLALLREARRQRAIRLRQARQAQWRYRMRRLRRAVVAVVLVAIAAAGASFLLTPEVSDSVWSVAMLAAPVLFFLLALYPSTPKPRAEDLHQADLPELAAATELWLESRRRALPQAALDAVDMIGVRLEQLGPQLATLDPAAPAAREVRKLLSDHLPGLVDSYTRIPSDLRGRPHAGKTPSNQLVDGLGVIAREIESMAHDLSRNDLDALATRGRFLEAKYVETDEPR